MSGQILSVLQPLDEAIIEALTVNAIRHVDADWLRTTG